MRDDGWVSLFRFRSDGSWFPKHKTHKERPRVSFRRVLSMPRPLKASGSEPDPLPPTRNVNQQPSRRTEQSTTSYFVSDTRVARNALDLCQTPCGIVCGTANPEIAF